MEKAHLSVTQLNMYLRCPRQYEFRYILGHKKPPSGALVLGRSWHQALEHNYQQKITTDVDLPIQEVISHFSDTFDNALKEEINLEDEDPGRLKDTGVNITIEHHKSIAPLVHPAKVEEEFNLDLGDNFPYTLKGIWDLIEKDGTIVDNKSYSKTPSQADLDRDLQFTAYSTAHRSIYQSIEPGLRMDCVIKTKKPKAIQLCTQRTNTDCRWFLSLVEKVAYSIQASAFPPNPTGWWCSQAFCGYWDMCHT